MNIRFSSLLTLAGAIAALTLVACSKDMTEMESTSASPAAAKILNTPDGAVVGELKIKVSEELAARLEAATATVTRAGGRLTRSGEADLDAALATVDVRQISRIFPYDEPYEARHRAFGLHRWYQIDFDDEAELQAFAEAVGMVEEVQHIEFSYEPKKMNVGPMKPYRPQAAADATRAVTMPMNDPALSKQWNYNNRGGLSVSYGAGHTFASRSGADINLFEAWKRCTGSPDIVVAVIDEPIQTTHPDLAANMWVNPKPGYNGSTGDIHGYNFYNKTDKLDWVSYSYNSSDKTYEYSDHGTHVAGTIAAVNNNNTCVCGIAGGTPDKPGVKVMTCQIFNNDKTNRNSNAAADAFVYAADRGAHIAQCSFGYSESIKTLEQWCKNDNSVERNAVDYFIANAGKDDPKSPLIGGLVIFSAGNSGDDVGDQMMWPAAYQPVVAVASMAPDYTPAYYTDFGSWVEVTAPGGDFLYSDSNDEDNGEILSTVLQDPSMTFRDGRTVNGMGWMQGTSMACPHVSGVAALGLSYAKQLGKRYTLDQFKSLLLRSCNNIDKYMVGGRDFYGSSGWATMKLSDYKGKMGAGFIDAYRLLLNIDGTPSVLASRNVPVTVDLTDMIGAAALSSAMSVNISADLMTKLGIKDLSVKNGRLTMTCTEVGAGTMSLRATIGETSMTCEVGLIVRESVASNGGWL